jgi:ankyrin repeat protein
MDSGTEDMDSDSDAEFQRYGPNPWLLEGQSESDTESDNSDDVYDSIDDVIEAKHPRQRYLNDGLNYALDNDKYEDVKMFIDYGADLNPESFTTERNLGWRQSIPLVVAAERDNPVAFEYLLSHGADTKRLWDIFVDVYEDNISLVKFFTKYPRFFKVMVDSVRSEEMDGDDWFFCLALKVIKLETQGPPGGVVKVLEMLLEFEPLHLNDDDEGVCADGYNNLLCTAIKCKSSRCFEVLLNRATVVNYGYDPDGLVKDYMPLHVAFKWSDGLDHLTPLDVASSQDDLETVMSLIERGEMCFESDKGLHPSKIAYLEWAPIVLRFFHHNDITDLHPNCDVLHLACFDEDVVSVMDYAKCCNVNSFDEKGRTPLVIAILRKNVHLVKLLFQFGADPKAKTDRGPCAIVTAVRVGNAEILDVVLGSCPGKIDLNDSEYKLLEVAITAQNQETFDRLIQLGVDVSKRDPYSVGPIHRASMMGNYQMLESLIEHGANVNDTVVSRHYSRNPCRRTPLGLCRDSQCIHLLLSHGSRIDYESTYTYGRRDLELCVNMLKEGNDEDVIMKAYWEKLGAVLADRFSVFDSMCIGGHHSLIDFLLSKNPKWRTECHRIGFFDGKKFCMFNRTIQLLLDLGCTFNFSRSFFDKYPDCTTYSKCAVRDRDTRQAFGVNLYRHQMFAFTKIVQERCGRNIYECVDGRRLVRLFVRTRDRNMITLLRDCGLKVTKQISAKDIKQILRSDGNAKVDIARSLDYFRSLQQICREPISLQNRCRIAIRRHWFSLKIKHCTISEAIATLPLPNCLKEFLDFTGQHEFQYLRYNL